MSNPPTPESSIAFNVELPFITALPSDIEIDVDAEEEYPISPGSPPPLLIPPPKNDGCPRPHATENDFTVPTGPLSPRSTLTILQSEDLSSGNLKTVAKNLAHTLIDCTAVYNQLTADLEAEVARVRTQAAPTPVTFRNYGCPIDFVDNEGRLPTFIIPHLGHRTRARYVRISPFNPTYAEGTMGGLTGDDGEVYSHPLHALPYHPHEGEENLPLEPLPEWFRELLGGTDGIFALFIDGGKKLTDWGVPADMARYRANSERIRELYAARETLDNSIETCRGNIDLAAARAADRLPAFRFLADRSYCTHGDEGRPLHQMHHGRKKVTFKGTRGRVPA
jgi:hypothetical protein